MMTDEQVHAYVEALFMNGITPSEIINTCQKNIDEINRLKSKISELTIQLTNNVNMSKSDFESEKVEINNHINYLDLQINHISELYVTRPELDALTENLNKKIDYEISNQKEENNIFLKNLKQELI